MLVALDGSRFAESALHHGRVLARALGSRLRLVTVLDPARSGGTAAGSAECRLQLLETKCYLEGLVRRLEREGIEAGADVREGSPVREILAAAGESAAVLVLVAARPRRREDRLLSRGVAQGIIAHGPGSVLVARGDGWRGRVGRHRGACGYARVTVGVDHSPGSRRALRLAASVAARQEARLLLIRVVSTPPGGTVEAGAADAAGIRLRQLRARLSASGPEVETVLCRCRPGRVPEAIEEAAREARADLIVVGARGSGRSDSLYGSCARRLLLHGELPVLVVRDARGRDGAPGSRAARCVARPRPRSRRPPGTPGSVSRPSF